ncbi:MAG TPA: hypothetical protein VGK19_05415 [Capsulimonadaceae bacterium]|jgi:hypothetical protein
MGIVNYRMSAHAELSLAERQIPRYVVDAVMDAPQQQVDAKNGCVARQSVFEVEGRAFLVRVIVDLRRSPVEVLTVYRTTNIDKYWVAEGGEAP